MVMKFPHGVLEFQVCNRVESEHLVTPVLLCGTVCWLQSRPLQMLHPSAGS